jgi:hypothetical protein
MATAMTRTAWPELPSDTMALREPATSRLDDLVMGRAWPARPVPALASIERGRL